MPLMLLAKTYNIMIFLMQKIYKNLISNGDALNGIPQQISES